jgi:hypothetical protein
MLFQRLSLNSDIIVGLNILSNLIELIQFSKDLN